jgi:murein DD-endopeptidase MepM/ murein hydrolase activator NlpD
MLAITAALSAALGACTSMENVFYGAREGTMEYPGSGAGPNAVPTYVAKYNDTVDGIAQRYGVTTQTIVDANRLQPPYPLRAGQTLAVPGAKFVAPAPPTEPATAAPAGPVRRESLAPPGQAEPSRAPPPAGEPTPLSPSSQSVTVQATPPRFDWPLQGKVVAGYGTAAGGQKNDGIDIQAAKGAPVKAADSGTVVYSGNEVRGLGNLLLVSHNSGYITAYANNESLLVKKGDAVKKGQAIAKVGTDSKLHFEVRRGNKTVDPMTVLPGQ